MIYLVVLLALLSGAGASQPSPHYEFPTEVEGWRQKGPDRIFDRNSIFKYIGGAGEVYLAYNFNSVVVRTYEKPGEPSLELAVFDMGNPGDAYGIFSYELEEENADVGQGGEYIAGLLRFWKNRYFVCVMADKDTPSSKKGAMAMGERIAAALPAPERKPRLLDHLPSEELKSIRYFHRADSLNRLCYVADENILSLGNDTDAVIARYGCTNPPCYVLLIAYKGGNEARRAFEGFTRAYLPEAPHGGPVKTENKCWICARTVRHFVLVVFDAPSRVEAERMTDRVQQLLKEDHCEQ